MNTKTIIPEGTKVGKLTVIKYTPTLSGPMFYMCKCECGKTKEAREHDLMHNRIKSCGCLSKPQSLGSPHVNLTGQVFGKLTVLQQTGRGRSELCLCKCECGRTKNVLTSRVLNGQTMSCRCMNGGRNRIDRTGQVFGKLTVIKQTWKNGRGRCLCKCECGKTTDVDSSQLVMGQVRSCGCIRNKDCTSMRFDKLTVIKQWYERRLARCLCRCDCGNTRVVNAIALRAGRAKSCGCSKLCRWPKPRAN